MVLCALGRFMVGSGAIGYGLPLRIRSPYWIISSIHKLEQVELSFPFASLLLQRSYRHIIPRQQVLNRRVRSFQSWDTVKICGKEVTRIFGFSDPSHESIVATIIRRVERRLHLGCVSGLRWIQEKTVM